MPNVRAEIPEHHQAPEGLLPYFQYTRAFSDTDKESKVPATLKALGGKGFSLCEMTKLGLPVPPGFIISAEAGRLFLTDNTIPSPIYHEISQQLIRLEKTSGEQLGNPDHPLIVSVRSGAEYSMPGAMKTLLNIGINDETVHALAKRIGEKAAWVAYYDAVKQFSSDICHVDMSEIIKFIDTEMERLSVLRINQLPTVGLQLLVSRAKDHIKNTCKEFPQNPREQLRVAIKAVFDSWNSPDAKEFRKQFHKSDDAGTAVTVQRMVWGNAEGEGSGSGVLLTRDPHTLGDAVVGFLPHMQGNAVVGYKAHPQTHIKDLPISDEAKAELTRWKNILETHHGFPRDMEFTIEVDPSGKEHAYVLQDRKEPLTNPAYILWLFEQVQNGYLKEKEVMRLATERMLYSVLAYDLDPAAMEKARERDLVAIGQPITNGHVTGSVVFSVKGAEAQSKLKVVLMAPKNSKVDLHTLPANVKGVFTHGGGIGSHSGRIAARMDKPIIFDGHIRQLIQPGDVVTLNGTTGEVFRGIIPVAKAPGSSLLTPEQVETAQLWNTKRSENPWLFTIPPDSEPAIKEILEAASKPLRAINRVKSRKAKVEVGFTSLIPTEIRMQYDVMKKDNAVGIKTLVKEILAAGRDATLRTGYDPDTEGGNGPWVSLTNRSEVEEFFTNPDYPKSKYLGYLTWVANPALSEIFVGQVPKDKLSADPAIIHEHCAWTLSCTTNNMLILQIHPHDPHLRELDDKDADAFITYTIPVDVRTGLLEDSLIEIGEKLVHDVLANDISALVEHTIRRWYVAYKLPARLAAIGEIFPIRDNFSTPSLQGQARIYPDEHSWVLSYDINNDPVRGSNGNSH